MKMTTPFLPAVPPHAPGLLTVSKALSGHLARKRRPKGMWQRTYERRQGELIDAEMLADQVFTDRVAMLFPMIERESLPADYETVKVEE